MAALGAPALLDLLAGQAPAFRRGESASTRLSPADTRRACSSSARKSAFPACLAQSHGEAPVGAARTDARWCRVWRKMGRARRGGAGSGG